MPRSAKVICYTFSLHKSCSNIPGQSELKFSVGEDLKAVTRN